MARAIANCTCSSCGKQFEKISFQRNRTEANHWKAWAEENLNTCYDCWKNQQEENLIADASEVLDVHYSVYKNQYSDCKTVYDSYNKESKTIKVIVPKNRQVVE